jgi:hypothetical protein
VTQRQIQDYLEDILDAVDAIEQFTAGIDYKEFSRNLEKIFAVSRRVGGQAEWVAGNSLGLLRSCTSQTRGKRGKFHAPNQYT